MKAEAPDTTLVLSADFELKETNALLSATVLKAYPELAGKYALIDKLYESTYLINESIYHFLALFSAPASLGTIYAQLGVDAASEKQVSRFVHDLRAKDILIPEAENDRIKHLLAQESARPALDVDPAGIVRTLKHTSQIWIGLVRDAARPEPYVLKKFLLPQAKKERQRLIREFTHEAAMHKAAQGHPNIVTLYGVNHDRQEMMLEYIKGKSIRKYVKEYNPPLRDRYRVISRILEVFEHLHAKGILHGDIHSSNFLITAGSEPVLLDFDMAGSMHDTNLKATKIGGVFPYAPPERVSTAPMQIFNRRQTSLLAEVYQLGIVFYMLLYHELPFDGITWKDLSGSILGLRPVWKAQTPAGESIPPAVIKTLQKSLEKKPENRFASVGAFAAAWEQTLKTL